MNIIPVASILVVTYNQEVYIGKTLDCLLMQECPFDYEILIGEDCSTDQTRNICIEYSRKHPDKIRLFLNEQNKGLINNYFDLLEHARGTYLADCGGDDCWLTTDKLKRQVELLVKHPEVGLVYGNWQKLYQKNNLLETNKTGVNDDWFNPRYYGSEAVRDYLNGRNFPKVVLSTSCFRADWLMDALQNNRDLFRGKAVVCEDLPITLCLLSKGPFYLMKAENIGGQALGMAWGVQVNPHRFPSIRDFKNIGLEPRDEDVITDLLRLVLQHNEIKVFVHATNFAKGEFQLQPHHRLGHFGRDAGLYDLFLTYQAVIPPENILHLGLNLPAGPDKHRLHAGIVGMPGDDAALAVEHMQDGELGKVGEAPVLNEHIRKQDGVWAGFERGPADFHGLNQAPLHQVLDAVRRASAKNMQVCFWDCDVGDAFSNFYLGE